jgi:hypothetical protein
MVIGDVLWGMIISYVLLGLVWLVVERFAGNRRLRRRNYVRSRMSVVRRFAVARRGSEPQPRVCRGGAGEHDDDLSSLRLHGNTR